MNVSYDVARNAINRQNTRLRKIQEGKFLKKNFEPIINPTTALEQLQVKIRRMQMEIDILKKFHEELRR